MKIFAANRHVKNKTQLHTSSSCACSFAAALVLVAFGSNPPNLSADDQPTTRLETEHFDRDPGWDNSVNRVEASDPPAVIQDFGWSPGRIGGTIWKSTTPAWHGMQLARPLSFKDAFSASGKITATPGSFSGGAAYLGFFNHERQGWRPWSSMALRLVNEGDRTLFLIDFMTGKWAAGAAEMDLSIPTDGSEHAWSLTYDPNATRAPWTDTRLHNYLTSSRARQTAADIFCRAKKRRAGTHSRRSGSTPERRPGIGLGHLSGATRQRVLAAQAGKRRPQRRSGRAGGWRSEISHVSDSRIARSAGDAGSLRHF